MWILYDCMNIRLFSDNNYEEKILQSDYLKTKLAYVFDCESNDSINLQHSEDCYLINIDFGKGRSLLDLDNGHVFINENLDVLQICYILRVILDAFIVEKNSLPLHAAMLSNMDKGVFVFGDTHCGKSIVSNSIMYHNGDFKVIGDDHIIVNEKMTIGNSKSRLRIIDSIDNNFASVCSNNILIDNKMYSPTTNDYIIFDIDINSKNNYFCKLDKDEYLDTDLSYVLKYLTNDFCTSAENIFMSRFIDIRLKEKYLTNFKYFVKNSYNIVKIRGDKNYVTNTINKYLVDIF